MASSIQSGDHVAARIAFRKMGAGPPVAFSGFGPRARLGDPGFLSMITSLGRSAAGMLPGGGLVTKAVDAINPGGRLMAMFQKHRGAIAGGALAGTALAGGGLAALLHGRGKAGAAGAAGAMMGPHRRRRRRMNPLNYRALVRSTRRIHAAKKIYSTVFHQAHQVHAPKKMPKGLRRYHRHRRARAAA